MKTCPRCKVQKEDSDFGKNRSSRSGLDTYCKVCRYEQNTLYRSENFAKVSDYRKNYYKEHVEIEKARMKEYAKGVKRRFTAPENRKKLEDTLGKRFNIPSGHYKEMLDQQDGVCAICQSKNKNGDYLAVDHDHSTGKLRELLCRQCNMTLGLVYEDTSILASMIKYLERHRS